MISTNIDGSAGGATQLFDLLSLVANPDAASKRLAELQEATAEHKRYVEAVAPVSEVLALRAQTQAAFQQANAELEAARQEAVAIKSAAASEAAAIKTAAAMAAKKVVEAAEAKDIAATAKLAESEARLRELSAQEQITTKLERDLVARATELETLRTQAQAELQKYAALKADLHAKHQAFISEL